MLHENIFDFIEIWINEGIFKRISGEKISNLSNVVPRRNQEKT